jgi:seryl-tRNA synthetase
MLQINSIRQNPELVKQKLAVKNFKQAELVDELLSLDERRKQLQFQADNTQARLNSAAREIGQLMSAGKKEEAEARKKEVADLKAGLQPIADELQQVEKSVNDTLVKLPNLPSDLVPLGNGPEDNVVVREGGTMPQLHANAVPHWDLTKKFGLIDFELGNKITGSGFPVYIGKGAKLQRSLIQMFLDYNISKGYTEFIPPHVVNYDSAFGTGQLPDKEGQMYEVTDNFYLIPTAEVPVTNIYRGEILKAGELPVRMTAYTPCFRREAGSYGKDVRGLNRLHQFDKVEVVQIVEPATSYDVLEEMVSHVENLVNLLQLPYRILRLCGGDMGFASALTYDFEVYSAAQQKWLEVSSVSNFESYQSNRMKMRYKDGDGKTQLVHTLNGSSLALPRIVACLLENNQQPDHIALPEAVAKYFGSDKIN